MELDKLDYKKEYIINYSKDSKTIDTSIKKECKILKFSLKYNLKFVLTQICRLNPKDYPRLFIFIIETQNIKNFDVKEIDKHYFNHFDKKRPIILQIIQNNESKSIWKYKKENSEEFVYLDKDCDGNEDLSELLLDFVGSNIDGFWRYMLNKFPKIKNSSVILRFLKTLNVSDEIHASLILKFAPVGSKNDLLAILDASFENDGRMLSINSKHIINTVYKIEIREFSVLQEAVLNKNEKVINYLISSCAHLIQQLPLDHRIKVSNTAMELNCFGILFDLLNSADFPFPSNFNESKFTDQKILQIAKDRKEFHKSIEDNNVDEIKNSINKNRHLKQFFNINNKTALACAAESKNFNAFVELKSLGFRAEEFRGIEDIKFLTDKEKKKLKDKAWKQTRKNADDALKDKHKAVNLLWMRSSIHNNMINKKTEDEHRKKIKEWLIDIFDISYCNKFLNTASQCEALKIIYDFDSESVENTDIKSGSGSAGTTYPKSKMIFIGAKITDENPEQKIKGVLIHEICHYVMRLLYENNDLPYYENDYEAAIEFGKVCKSINKWAQIENRSEDNEESSLQDDENFQEDEQMESDDDYDKEKINSDQCDGIISSVYKQYGKNDHQQELIVRPLHILVQFHADESKVKNLQIIYKDLFDFVERRILPELNKFSLQDRVDLGRMNKFFGVISKIKSQNLELKSSKIDFKDTLEQNSTIIFTNAPQLAILDINEQLKEEHLASIRNIYITSDLFENKELLDEISKTLKIIGNLRIIIDFSLGVKGNVDFFKIESLNFVFIISNHEQKTKLLNYINSDYEEKTINYTFADLDINSQTNLLNIKINFQNNYHITLKDLCMEEVSTSNLESQLKKVADIITNDLFLMLLNKSQISINSNSQEDNCEKYFNALYQLRNLKNLFGSKTQDEFLDEIRDKRTILISDSGGTGKSWILKFFSQELCKKIPKKWTSYVDLKQHINSLANQDMQNFSQFMIEKVLKINETFVGKIFNNLYQNGRIIALFDGFDEIPVEYSNILLSILASFDYENGNQLWIATRNYCEEKLRRKILFDVEYQLAEFTEEDGINLIVKTWLLNESSNQSIELYTHESLLSNPKYIEYKEIVKNLIEKILESANQPIGYPLLYKMIANVYKNKKENIEYYSLFFLFDSFAKQYFNRWSHEKEGFGKGELLNTQEKNLNFLELHQFLAMKSLIPKKIKYIEKMLGKMDWTNDQINACGVGNKNNDAYLFQHKTFREFFAAKFIFKILINGSNYEDQDFWQILKDILTMENFENVHMFLKDALASETFKNVDNTLNLTKKIKNCPYSSEIFLKIFKEDLKHIDHLLTTRKEAANYKKIKVILNVIIQGITKKGTSDQDLKKAIDLISNFVKLEDFKQLIIDQDVIQNVFAYRNDIKVIEFIIMKVQDNEFIKKILRSKFNVNKNVFKLFCKSSNLNIASFTQLLGFLQNYFFNGEIIEIVQECEGNEKIVIYVLLEIINQNQEEKICEKFQQLCKMMQNSIDFLNIIRQTETNFYDTIGSYDNDLFHQTFWKLLLCFIQNEDELKHFIKKKDNNDDNYFQLLVKHNKINITKSTFDFMIDNIGSDICKEIITSKDKNGRNLFTLSFVIAKEAQIRYLWHTIKNLFKDKHKIEPFLLEVDIRSNNIVHLIAIISDFTTETRVAFNEMFSMLHCKNIPSILKAENEDKQNFLHMASTNNTNVDCYNYLWELIYNNLDRNEVLNMINSTDNFGNNILYSAAQFNSREVIEKIWNEIQTILSSNFKQIEYLNKEREDGMTLAEMTKENQIHSDVSGIIESFNDHISSARYFGSPVKLWDKKWISIYERDTIKQIFHHTDVKSRKIASISIIGTYHNEKSLFSNYCLRYLYANYPSINFPNNPLSNPDAWLGDAHEPLSGFSLISENDHYATSIVMWNDVFLHTDEKTGDKIAIIIMDTQGVIDNQTTQTDNLKVFTLATLISSLQILNLSGDFQVDQFQFLHLATEFAQFVSSNNQGFSEKCFQNLYLLIRDWENTDEYAFGIEGGTNYLINCLKDENVKNKKLKSVFECINNSFMELNCSLLPQPGILYDDGQKEMDKVFKKQLSDLIPHIFNSNKLVLKNFNGCNANGSEFLEYINQYYQLFKSDELPQAQTIYDATVAKQMTALINDCCNNYKETVYKNRDALNNESNIKILHEGCKNKALLIFSEAKKMGNSEHEAKYKQILGAEIDKLFEEWGQQTIESINKIAEEVEKTRIALEEKHRLEREQLESEKKAVERVIEIEMLKAKTELELARYNKEMEIALIKWETDQKRKAAERQLELERLKHEKEIEYQLFKAEYNASKIALEIEKSHQAAEKVMKELKHQKFLREIELKEAHRKHEQERLSAENAKKFKILKRKKAAEFEKCLKDRENAKMRLQVEREKFKILELEEKREQLIRRELEIQNEIKQTDKCVIS